MESNNTLQLENAVTTYSLPLIVDNVGNANMRDTVQKDNDKILGVTKVAPTGSLFMAATRVAVTGAGATVAYPILGEKTGIVYIVSDPGTTTVPGKAIFKIAVARPGYFFYLTYNEQNSGNYLEIDPSIMGTTINDSTSVWTQYIGAVIFVGTDTGWYTMMS